MSVEVNRPADALAGVDAGLWAELNAELSRQLALTSRKSAAGQLPPPEKHRVDDLELHVEGSEAWFNWTYKNPGDFDLNGEVNHSDLVPIALRYLASTGEPEYLTAVDGDSNGEINQGDIATIAQNWGNQLSGYAIGPELGDADGNGEINLVDLTPMGLIWSHQPGELEGMTAFDAGDPSDYGTVVEPGSPGLPGPYACIAIARPGNGNVTSAGVLEFRVHLNPEMFLENFQIAVVPVLLNMPPYEISNPVIDEKNLGEFAIVTMPAPIAP